MGNSKKPTYDELLNKCATNDKIISALVQRVESSMELGSSSFALFEGHAALSKQVETRTLELMQVTQALESEKNKKLSLRMKK